MNATGQGQLWRGITYPVDSVVARTIKDLLCPRFFIITREERQPKNAGKKDDMNTIIMTMRPWMSTIMTTIIMIIKNNNDDEDDDDGDDSHDDVEDEAEDENDNYDFDRERDDDG